MKKLQELIKRANGLGYDVHSEISIYYLDKNKDIIEKYADDSYVDYEILDSNKDLFNQIESFKNIHENYKEIETRDSRSLKDVKYLQTEIIASLHDEDGAIDSDTELSGLVNDMNVELCTFDNIFKSGNNSEY